jgi:1,4-alpha-glucan branching enzyme
MALIPVHFEYRTGLRQPFLTGARLGGAWDARGRRSEAWRFQPMQAFTDETGCPAFRATVELDDGAIGETFAWGVSVDTPTAAEWWGIPTEVSDQNSGARQRRFVLQGADQTERYYLTHCRRLGANKRFGQEGRQGVHFAVWAPNARNVEVVRGEASGGYIWDDGRGVVAAIAMRRGQDGVWVAGPEDDAALAEFSRFAHTPYMFRITKDDGTVAYRTDLYSRCQIGSGRVNPEVEPSWSGRREDLDGVKSCSVVVDPDRVCRPFRQVDAEGRPVWPETQWDSEEEFWREEFDPERPVPTALRDLVIYEMHVDGLGLGRHDRGMLEDAIDLLDYLVELGVNAVELMPFSEYEGWSSWGYGTSHYMAMEYAGGGRDQFKHFVRACHRRGIAVIFDVVYNHYTHDGERAQWTYDSNAHERNIYYWYEGLPSDYPAYEEAARRHPHQAAPGHGGYIDNLSTGYAPRYWDEMVRKVFISSAAHLVSEFHIDGFRVDQTTSIHAYPVRHADGRPVEAARAFGAKFLREWTRTLRLIKPDVILTAEDHSGWDAVTSSSENGGLGFDAVWYSDYYHHLIGDAQNDGSRARLLKFAGYGDDRPLNMSWFAGALGASARRRVVYHESHDEAGNSYYIDDGERISSARTIKVAVNGAALAGETRRYAEARTRVAAGLTFCGPGVPMFFMGEEVGASEPYRFDDFLQHREDFPALRRGEGARLFGFYQDAIRLRLEHRGLRSTNIDILAVHDTNRFLAFRRWEEEDDFLVLVSFNNRAFGDGYVLRSGRLGEGRWREVLNSDATAYGGDGLDNPGTLGSDDGAVSVRLPANAIVVLQRQ